MRSSMGPWHDRKDPAKCSPRHHWGLQIHDPGSVTNLLKKCNPPPPLQERRRHLRLTLFYTVVEELPPDNFLEKQKPGRFIRSRPNPDATSTNPINKYARHNDRPYKVTPTRTEQHRNFFVRTVIEWKRLEKNIVHAESTHRFKTLVLSTRP